MAVDEPATYWPTDNLILKSNRKHYRSAVAPIHWQLRSLISAERNDIIYYPAGVNNTHITRLNTLTRECETIKVISFHPRCLVAKGGWICCGGEKGEFAVIRDVGQTEGTEDLLGDEFRASFPSIDPANLAEASMLQLHQEMLGIMERINNKTWSTTNHKFGTARVNCITIWLPRKGSHTPTPSLYQRPVAVLANNDQSITIVSLFDNQELDHITLPDAVNRAVISPDGSLLAAICDDPYLYVYVRAPVDKTRDSQHYEWKQLPPVRLQGQTHTDCSDSRGSFAAAFSPSGNYLAIGTQYGTICIFDTSAFDRPDVNPLLAYFDSSRSPHESGAIRDMAFSPAPHDLLAWTEHRGRVGIADVRTNFTQRQIISIENHENFESLALNDRSTIDPRLLDPRSERAAASSTSLSNVVSPGSSGRPLPNPGNAESAISRLNLPFTTDETIVLEAVQQERRRRDAAREQQDQNASTHGGPVWRSADWFDRRQTLSRLLDNDLGSRRAQIIQSSVQNTASSEQERERRSAIPRRTTSVTQQSSTQNTQSSNGRRVVNNETSATPNAATSRDSPTPWGRQTFTAEWTPLGALYSSSSAGNALNDTLRSEAGRTRRAIPVINNAWHDDVSSYRRIGRSNSREHSQQPDDTAGLSWSEDGRKLYVAAEDGLYQLAVNLQARKLFPDISLR
ncbi:WD40-repeat-containing domain protein [Microdochium bolleyi]|uniref:WD40-repeat-containing domain protein n=1 Tax=Microdochium bolleyi TaxID=196109 RepID=A0A136J5A8_9PEZI|nr:WD40-repeat-containing domain protein [Microdochium bolleyi]